MRWLLALCLMLSLAAMCQAVPVNGIPMNGVTANERIVRLPEDGSKWFISVIGDDSERYKEVLGWFDSGKLLELKNEVHFNAVTKDMPIYARYTPVKDLPTVRVQDATGVVLFEASGNKLPMSGESLYNAIADKVNGSEHWLPWRKHKPDPKPDPTPDPTPDPKPDPAPQPIDSGGPPAIESVEDNTTLVLICVFLLVIGVGSGVIRKLKSGKTN